MEKTEILVIVVVGAMLLLVGWQAYQVMQLRSVISNIELDSGNVYITGYCRNGTQDIRIDNISIIDPAYVTADGFGRWVNIRVNHTGRQLVMGQGYANYGGTDGDEWLESLRAA